MGTYRNRIVKYEGPPHSPGIRAGDLIPDPRNWRTHPSAQVEALRAMMERIGVIDTVIVREVEGGAYMLVDGHLRAGLDPDEPVPALVVDLDTAEAGEALLTHDPIAALAEADVDAIHKLLDGAAPGLPDLDLVQRNIPGSSYVGGGLLDQWEKKSGDDTSGDTMLDTAGFKLSSVWIESAADEACVFRPYALSLPTDRAGRRFSRSPLPEMQRIVATYLRPGDVFVELCAGWWTFTCTAALAGHRGTGVDLWDESIKFARRQLRKLPHDVRDRVTVRQGDATDTGLPAESADYVYSNVPFIDTELYSGDERDLAASSVTTWSDNIERLFRETRRILKPGGLVSFVITDVRKDGRLVRLSSVVEQAVVRVGGLGLHDLVVQHMRSAGIRLWRRAYDRRRVVKEHEYVMTWRKDGGGDMAEDEDEPAPDADE